MNKGALTFAGLGLLLVGAALYLTTPHHVTWGHHHYLPRFGSGALLAVGLVLLVAGMKRSG